MTEIPTKSKMVMNVSVGIATIIVGVIAVAWFVTTVALPQHTQQLTNTPITINAQTSNYVQFSTPNNAINPTVSGRFTASGGTGNDIAVMVLSQDDFINWQNGHASTAYYSSGKTTVGMISVTVPSGQTLYLVFDNTFSLVSAKSVNSNILLTYR